MAQRDGPHGSTGLVYHPVRAESSRNGVQLLLHSLCRYNHHIAEQEVDSTIVLRAEEKGNRAPVPSIRHHRKKPTKKIRMVLSQSLHSPQC